MPPLVNNAQKYLSETSSFEFQLSGNCCKRRKTPLFHLGNASSKKTYIRLQTALTTGMQYWQTDDAVELAISEPFQTRRHPSIVHSAVLRLLSSAWQSVIGPGPHTIPYHTTPYHAIPFNAISFYNIPNHTMLSHTLWTPYHTRPTGPHGPYHTIWSPYTRLPGHHHRIARPSCTPIPSTNWVRLNNTITKSYKDRHPHYLTSTFRAGWWDPWSLTRLQLYMHVCAKLVLTQTLRYLTTLAIARQSKQWPALFTLS